MAVYEHYSLQCTEGRSNKVYHVQISEIDSGAVPAGSNRFRVDFQFGPRGGSLQSGTKTAVPVSLEDARKIAARLVKEKIGKGYQAMRATAGEAAAYTPTPAEDARRTPYRPQLLNAISYERLQEVLDDDAFLMQVKMDGKRITVRKRGEEVVAINRKGLIVGAPVAVLEAVGKVPRDLLIDGELVGDNYYPFDLLSFGPPGNTLEKAPFGQRAEALAKVAKAAGWETNVLVHALSTVTGKMDKRQIFEAGRISNVEGFCFKRADSLWVPGKPASGGDQLKWKFKSSATCMVSGIHPSKRSVSLYVKDGVETRGVGNCTIPANHEVPLSGMLVEIEYLYCFPDGSLYQPVYKGRRTDLDTADDYSTLKFKPVADRDADEEA